MNAREKELYLREYSLLKAQGKPFFPYAVAKDSIMAVFVLIAIIVMSLMFGAELGPEGGPDDDHLRAAARSGTSSSSSSCCGSSSRRS